ncbi:hypothetical protein HDU97_006468 [Phlyctochytrium planicorne]|nr:hypothetical protein HDU97_006468 [Phlyctochytrium planicorne]
MRVSRRTLRLLRRLPIWIAYGGIAFFTILNIHLLTRDRSVLYVPHAIQPASPLSSASCYLQHLKFASGLLLFMDRVRDSAPCSKAVRDAMVDISRYHAGKGWSRSETYVPADPSCGSVEECGVEWVFYTTACNSGVNRLAGLLEAQKIPLTVLGRGKGWRGWGQRVRAYHDYLSTLPKHRLVVLSDGEDVLLAPSCDADELKRRFRERTPATSPILVSAEMACWPEGNLWHRYYKKDLVSRPAGMRDPRCTLRGNETPMNSDSQILPRWDINMTSSNPESDPFSKLERRGAGGVAHVGGGPVTDDIKSLLQCSPTSMHADYFRFLYLNAGTMMGRAGDLVDLFRDVYRDDCIDDQLEFSRSYLSRRLFYIQREMEEQGTDSAGDEKKLMEELEKAMADVDKAEVDTGTISPSSNTEYPYPNPKPHPKVFEARSRLGKAADVFDHGTEWAEPTHGKRSKHHRNKDGDRRIRRQATPEQYAKLAKSSPDKVGKAHPLIALDFDNDMFAALYSVFYTDLDVNSKTGVLQVLDTKGLPCILHQNGRKVENRVLDEIARSFGMPFNAKAIERSYWLSGKSRGKGKDEH